VIPKRHWFVARTPGVDACVKCGAALLDLRHWNERIR